MLQKISAWMGLVMCVIGGPLKVLRVLRQGEWWPFFLYDFLALALLLVGAIAILRGGSGRWLAAGWGFGVAMFYGSFFDHLERLTHGQGTLAFERTMVNFDAVFLAVNVIGLAFALVGPPKTVAAL
jgi:hypothetical protein